MYFPIYLPGFCVFVWGDMKYEVLTKRVLDVM